MREENIERTGGEVLVDQLVIQGVDRGYCVPGESYLAVLDALYESNIELVTCRHEGGASMMAEAYGKLTNKPGICFVTRAPGFVNAMSGIHIAMQDSTPMIVFVGQIDTKMREREAFQEMNYRALLSDHVKWVTEIDDAARIPEIIGRAFHMATSGRPGPVVIALPEDMLVEKVTVRDSNRITPVAISPSVNDIAQFEHLLSSASSPIMILGGSQWSAESVARIEHFAAKNMLPVAVQLRRQMLFSTEHEAFIGDVGLGINPYLRERIETADLVILLGGRFSENPSQSYELLKIPVPQQTLIHIHADINELNRVYQPDLAINANPEEFTKALSILKLNNNWPYQVQQDRAAYLEWRDTHHITIPGALQMGEVMAFLNQQLPADTIITNGAGNFSTWVHRFYHFRGFGTQVAPTSGTMGYGLPAAIAAKQLHPERLVVCFAGDGDFMMSGEEFATAVQYNVPIIVIVLDNAMFGTIRMHQEMHYPKRVIGTMLQNPDFSAYAEAFGGRGFTVETTEEFFAAWAQALVTKSPVIIHCLLDSEAITPQKTLTQMTQKDGRDIY